MIESRAIPPATPRRAMTTKRKLASCLAQMRHPNDVTKPLIPNAETLTDDEIIAAVHFDHIVALELSGADRASNIMPLPVVAHVTVKTPADAAKSAKARRNRKREERHREVMLARTIGDDPPRDIRKHRIPNRPFEKRRRPMNWRKKRSG